MIFVTVECQRIVRVARDPLSTAPPQGRRHRPRHLAAAAYLAAAPAGAATRQQGHRASLDLSDNMVGANRERKDLEP